MGMLVGVGAAHEWLARIAHIASIALHQAHGGSAARHAGLELVSLLLAPDLCRRRVAALMCVASSGGHTRRSSRLCRLHRDV